jgi:hypothetical protein
MKKLLGGVKRAFSSGSSSRGSSSYSGDVSQDSVWSSSFVPSPHETRGSIRYLAHDDVPIPTDGDGISSIAPWRWRSTSLSASVSLVTLMYTM